MTASKKVNVNGRNVWASVTPTGKIEVKEAGMFGKVYGTFDDVTTALEKLAEWVDDGTIPHYKPR